MFSELRSLREGLSRLVADLEPGLVSGADAVKLVRGFAAIAKLANAGQTLAANRVAETGTWATQGDRSAAHFLARTTGTSTGQAINAMETAKRLTELPATEAALRAGELSQPQADEIASAAAADPGAEADVLRTARRDSLKGLRQRCRRVRAAALPDEVSRHEAVRKSRYLRHWSDADGAFRMDLRTTPDDGAAILAGLRPFREEIFLRARQAGQREPYEAYQAYALVAMAEAAAGGGGNGRGGSPSGPRATVQVRVDHEALLRGHVEAGETCEVEGVGPIPVATARSMMADAVLSAILTRGTEVTKVVHLGRTVSAHQRTALEARDPVCIVPGCDVAERLEIDHRTGWASPSRPASTIWPGCAGGTTTSRPTGATATRAAPGAGAGSTPTGGWTRSPRHPHRARPARPAPTRPPMATPPPRRRHRPCSPSTWTRAPAPAPTRHGRDQHRWTDRWSGRAHGVGMGPAPGRLGLGQRRRGVQDVARGAR